MYDTDFGFGPFWNWGNYNEDTLSFALYPDETAGQTHRGLHFFLENY